MRCEAEEAEQSEDFTFKSSVHHQKMGLSQKVKYHYIA